MATTKLTECDLVKTKRRMLKWLRGKKPRSVVTIDLMSENHCLFANFFKAQGLKNFDVLRTFYVHDCWVAKTLDIVKVGKNGDVTAANAIKAVEAA